MSVANEERAPNDGPGNCDKGISWMGESGDDDGEGSDRDDESVHETVVVGDESADSDVCVDVLSWCLWAESADSVFGCKCCVGTANLDSPLAPIAIIFGSTTVTVS